MSFLGSKLSQKKHSNAEPTPRFSRKRFKSGESESATHLVPPQPP